MHELEMNGQVVQFNFGVGFLKEINRTVSVPVDGMSGVRQNVGLRYTVSLLYDRDVEALEQVLYTANIGCDPRIAKKDIESFIDNPNTDIDDLFEKTLGFLKTANATKSATMMVIKEIEKEKARLEAMEKMRMETAM